MDSLITADSPPTAQMERRLYRRRDRRAPRVELTDCCGFRAIWPGPSPPCHQRRRIWTPPVIPAVRSARSADLARLKRPLPDGIEPRWVPVHPPPPLPRPREPVDSHTLDRNRCTVHTPLCTEQCRAVGSHGDFLRRAAHTNGEITQISPDSERAVHCPPPRPRAAKVSKLGAAGADSGLHLTRRENRVPTYYISSRL